MMGTKKWKILYSRPFRQALLGLVAQGKYVISRPVRQDLLCLDRTFPLENY